jgi:hypothetical protein
LTGNPITTRKIHAEINHRNGSQHSDWLAAGQYQLQYGDHLRQQQHRKAVTPYQKSMQDVRDLRHLLLLQQGRTD